MIEIQYVPTHHVHQTWSKVEEFLSSALSFSDDYTADQAKVFLASGSWLLLVGVDNGEIKGAAAVNFINLPNDRIGFVIAIGGRLISSHDTYAQLVAIMKANGATRIQGAARPAIARLWKRYGFTEKYAIVESAI